MSVFLQNGIGLTMVGAVAAVVLGCLGSARGIRIAAGQAAGVLSEKPELFGKLLVLMALPGTQGFYAFISAILMSQRIGLLAGNPQVSTMTGLALLAVGVGNGFVQWRSAVAQGETSAASINLVARQPDAAGRAILLPALVETYALIGLLASIVLTLFLTKGAA